MNENKLEVTILSKYQVFGDDKLDIIDKIGTECAVTDFALLLSDFVSEGNSPLKGIICKWCLKTRYTNDSVWCVSKDPVVDMCCSRSYGVRPVLKYFDISDTSFKIVNNNDLFEIEYGEYPQYVVDSELMKTLENEYAFGNIKKTGKIYTTDSMYSSDYEKKFKPANHEELEYNGKKYVRMKSHCNFKNILSNNIEVQEDDIVWFNVSPIIWYFDEKSKLLISKTALASGIRFCDDEKYSGNFKETDMYMFLNNYFIKDIIPSKNNEIINNENIVTNDNKEANEGEKIDELCLQIEKLANYYYGNRDYIREVHKLIEDYNNNLKKAKDKNTTKNEFNLSLEVLDIDLLYNKITIDLNNILNELKDYYETHKNHIKMLEYIRKCTNILNREDDDVSEVFFDDLVKIRDIVSPYIKEKTILENIKGLFKEYENELIKYLKGEDSEVSEIKSLEELKKDIASKMTPYLIKLNQEARNNDILNDIVERYKSLSETIEKQNRNKHIMFWFDEIEKCMNEIRDKGKEEDIKNLDELTKDNNFISDSVDISINKVYTLYMKVYRILLDIDERNKMDDKYNNFRSRY